MSAMIQFPVRPFPVSIRSAAPYVIFILRGQKVNLSDKTPDIPLMMVLHFIPKMKDWVVDPPSNLVRSFQTSLVGIRIPEEADVPPYALQYIVDKMLQLTGLSLRVDIFQLNPAISDSVLVLKAWRAFDLPAEGAQGVETNILTRLMTGPPVQFAEVKALWEVFPTTSPIVDQMAENFIRSWIDNDYTEMEAQRIHSWITDNLERKWYFKAKSTTLVGPGTGWTARGRAPHRSDPATKASSSKTKKLTMRRSLSRVRSNSSLRSVETEDPPATPRKKSRRRRMSEASIDDVVMPAVEPDSSVRPEGKGPVAETVGQAGGSSESKKGKERAVELCQV